MKRSFDDRIGVICLFAAIAFSVGASLTIGARPAAHAAIVTPVPAVTPIYTGYKGVKIGMSDEDARKLLGPPKEKGEGQDYYVYSENETAQVQYDATHKVTTVSVTYLGKSSSIPTPK